MQMYVTDRTKLREMLDCPEGAWNTIVEHASTCEVNDEISFTYSVDGIGLLFNSVYNLVAATVDGQNYRSVDDPTFSHKPLVKSIQEQAYRNVSSFVPVDGRAIFCPSKSLPSLQDEPISGSTTGLQHPEFPVADQGMHFDCHLSSTSSSYMGGLENHSNQLQLPVAQNTHQMFGNYNFKSDELFSPSNEQSVLNFSHATTSSPSTGRLGNHSHQFPLPIPQTFDYNLGMDEFFSPSNDEIVPNIASEMTSLAPVNATLEHNNGFYLTSTSNGSEFGHIANTHGMQIVHGRDGKRSRLTGELNIMLSDGVVIIYDLSFTDKFNWIKSRKSTLGAAVMQSICGQVSIKEAISEAFVVKDHRAEVGTEMEREIQEMQELKADMIREMNREMNREMQELKADMIREMKEYMQRLVRSSSAECNVNARCSLDYSQLNNHFMTESYQTYNSPSTGLLLNQFQVLYQGMQNDCNYASSEIDQTHVNEQLTLSKDNHQPLNNGDSGWNSLQSNEHDFLQLSPNTRLMIGLLKTTMDRSHIFLHHRTIKIQSCLLVLSLSATRGVINIPPTRDIICNDNQSGWNRIE